MAIRFYDDEGFLYLEGTNPTELEKEYYRGHNEVLKEIKKISKPIDEEKLRGIVNKIIYKEMGNTLCNYWMDRSGRTVKNIKLHHEEIANNQVKDATNDIVQAILKELKGG